MEFSIENEKLPKIGFSQSSFIDLISTQTTTGLLPMNK